MDTKWRWTPCGGSCQPCWSRLNPDVWAVSASAPSSRLLRSCVARRVDSVIVEAECECHGCACFFHFSRRQSGNAIAEIALGHGLEVVEVCRTDIRQPVVFCQDDFRGDTADSGGDGCNGDRVQHGDDGIAREYQRRPLLVRCLECVPAHVASIHDAPQSCSLSQTSNSPGATGLRV